jgi:hypothetical protein
MVAIEKGPAFNTTGEGVGDAPAAVCPRGAARRGIPLQLMLAYRDGSAFAEMVALYEEFLDDLPKQPIGKANVYAH